MVDFMSQSVIVLGSNPATRLSLIRCVGKIEGCRVTVINMVSQLPEKPFRTLDSYSKYVDHWLFAKKFDAEGLARILLDQCRVENERPVLLSVDDDSACLIDSIQDRIREYFCFANIDNKAGAIAELMDKSRQKELAKAFGFNVAEAWPINCIEGKYTIPEGVKYPCYVKGRLSYHSAKQLQRKCNSEQDLTEWLKVVAKQNPSPLLIEEFIEIEKDFGIIGYSDSQTVVLPGVVELLDGGHGGHKGVSAFGRVNDFNLNESLEQQIIHFIKHIHLSGLFNIDLVESHGELYFVELNLRFAAYGYAVFKAGVNLPAFQIFQSQGKDIKTLNTKLVNRYCYVNERVAFDDVTGGFRSWNNYRRLIKKADCRMIQDDEDPQPYEKFKSGMLITYLKAKIKKVIYHK
jgi:predicted ATP-grasp superfamily ATP-dependent carboligase